MLFSKNGPLVLKFPGTLKIIPWLLKYLTYSSPEKVNYISEHLAPLLANSVIEHKNLAEGTEAAKWIEDSPFLFIYKNKSDFIKDSFTWNIRKKYGYKLIEVDKNELQELVPGLSNEYSFAIKIENQGYISNSKKYLSSPGISVVKEAMIARNIEGIHAMHDPTEGGLATAIKEICIAGNVGANLSFESIPILPECITLCSTFGLDPLGLLASGSLLICVDNKYSLEFLTITGPQLT